MLIIWGKAVINAAIAQTYIGAVLYKLHVTEHLFVWLASFKSKKHVLIENLIQLW